MEPRSVKVSVFGAMLVAALSLSIGSEAAETQDAAVELEDLRPIAFTVQHLHGDFGSYGPPAVGDTFSIDFARVAELGRMDCEPADERLGPCYIPIVGGGSLRVDDTELRWGGMERVRLVVQSDDGRNSLRIQLEKGRDQKTFRVWMLFEHDGWMHGMAIGSGPIDGNLVRGDFD